MGEIRRQDIDINEAEAFLVGRLKMEASGVALIGEGAWSRCFGFRQGEQELVIRFGYHVDDFQKDRLAYRFATPELPIPKVLDVGQAFDGYYAISTRAYGVPLESLDAAQWRVLVPSVVSALEAMRLADLSSTSGFGGWGAERSAAHATWSSCLLSVGDDTPDQRRYGWRERLAGSPQGDADFTWGFDLLSSVVSDSVPRCLVHSDLVNRNAVVDGDRIAGIFDWGCSLYGDHLLDLAWFEFWAPWFPKLDMDYLRSELEQQWRSVGYAPQDKESRLMACYLHIGLDHLADHAYLGDGSAMASIAARMRALASAP